MCDICQQPIVIVTAAINLRCHSHNGRHCHRHQRSHRDDDDDDEVLMMMMMMVKNHMTVSQHPLGNFDPKTGIPM